MCGFCWVCVIIKFQRLKIKKKFKSEGMSGHIHKNFFERKGEEGKGGELEKGERGGEEGEGGRDAE